MTNTSQYLFVLETMVADMLVSKLSVIVRACLYGWPHIISGYRGHVTRPLQIFYIIVYTSSQNRGHIKTENVKVWNYFVKV